MTNTENPAVAVIGSPSTNTELAVDVLRDAADQSLVGSMISVDFRQDHEACRLVGQITEIEMRNRMHEDETFRTMIQKDGRIDSISDVGDVRMAKVSVGGVFRDTPSGWEHGLLGSVPATGTPVLRLDQEAVDALVENQKHLVTRVGRAYGDDKVDLPIWLRHFGDPDNGGYGEAYHSLIVGRTGSGKSTLAKMALAAYARHKSMGILVIDPKGEFSDEFSGRPVGRNALPLSKVLAGYGRKPAAYRLTDIQLEELELLPEFLLRFDFPGALRVKHPDAKKALVELVMDLVETHRDLDLEDLCTERALEIVMEELRRDPMEEDVSRIATRIYKSKDAAKSTEDTIDRFLADDQITRGAIIRAWNQATYFFARQTQGGTRRRRMSDIIYDVFHGKNGIKPVIALDVSKDGNLRALQREQIIDRPSAFVNEAVQNKVVGIIVRSLRETAERVLNQFQEENRRGENVNTLVVFEEAHRFAPRSTSGRPDTAELQRLLVNCIRETRKYGLGWLFVDQTIGGLARDIVQQIRIGFFGYGLVMGEELENLREITGASREDMDLYRSFRDPANYGSLSASRYPWMAFGPISPLSATRPLFFNAFNADDFQKRNGLRLADPEEVIEVGAAQKRDRDDGHSQAMQSARGGLKGVDMASVMEEFGDRD